MLHPNSCSNVAVVIVASVVVVVVVVVVVEVVVVVVVVVVFTTRRATKAGIGDMFRITVASLGLYLIDFFLIQ